MNDEQILKILKSVEIFSVEFEEVNEIQHPPASTGKGMGANPH